MKHSDEIDKLAAALAKAQGMMKPPEKTAENPHVHSRYAPLPDIRKAIVDAFSPNGLSLIGDAQVQTKIKVLTDPELGTVHSTPEDWLTVHFMILHESGQWLEGERTEWLLPEPGKLNQPLWVIGTSMTYLTRYISQIVGFLFAEEDDDGVTGDPDQDRQEFGERRGGQSQIQRPTPPQPVRKPVVPQKTTAAATPTPVAKPATTATPVRQPAMPAAMLADMPPLPTEPAVPAVPTVPVAITDMIKASGIPAGNVIIARVPAPAPEVVQVGPTKEQLQLEKDAMEFVNLAASMTDQEIIGKANRDKAVAFYRGMRDLVKPATVTTYQVPAKASTREILAAVEKFCEEFEASIPF